MIAPTPGRIVWFHPGPNDRDLRPSNDFQLMAAIVAYVWNDRLVNLSVISHNGAHVARTSVPLLQDDDAKIDGGSFACWMPYQKGQAAKHDAAKV